MLPASETGGQAVVWDVRVPRARPTGEEGGPTGVTITI